MRFIQGIVIGIAITVGAAFVHDSMAPRDAVSGLLEKQQIVNWDVLGRVANDQVQRAKDLWNHAFGR
jgi:hypothetical protein